MIICEMATNWRDLSEAREMIRVAKEAGAGLVKFQLFDAEDDRGKTWYDWVKAHELTFEDAKLLFDYGAHIGQEVFFSVFGAKYVDWCERIGVKRYKVASGYRDQDTIAAIRRTRKPVIISSCDNEVPNLSSWDALYCPPGYPAKITGQTYRNGYAGLSDHTIGLDAARIALARGARIVEKHFLLEHNPEFPDDDWSMTPAELAELVLWDKVCQEALYGWVLLPQPPKRCHAED